MNATDSAARWLSGKHAGGDLLGFVSAATVVSCVHVQTGWWLNSSRGVGWTISVLFILAAALEWEGVALFWRRSGAIWCGAMSALTLTLIAIGPGTIWPIVLVASGLLTGLAVVAGAWFGRVLVRHVRHP